MNSYNKNKVCDRFQGIDLFKWKDKEQIESFGVKSVPEEEFPARFLLPDRSLLALY